MIVENKYKLEDDPFLILSSYLNQWIMFQQDSC